MKYVIQNNPFDEEAYTRLIQRELHSKVAENIRLKQELDDLKKKNDIPSAYPGSTFGLALQECKVRPTFVIDKVLFNPPATIVFWQDGTKTVVKCKEGEEFSEWAGIALCLAKKLYGPNFHKIFKAHCSDPEKTVNDMTDEEITKAAREGVFSGMTYGEVSHSAEEAIKAMMKATQEPKVFGDALLKALAIPNKSAKNSDAK